jgi:crotonobetainyl-CoA:carnitine CoA-transferase CaiB-like acyl-CoA transferase
MKAEKHPGPLQGLRVIELANVIAGPTAGQILADFGAEVIKIEHPEHGDGSRRQGRTKDGEPLWFKMLGRNKKSVCMYLGDPEAAEIFLDLVKTADVVTENFRPGTLEKWNLGYDRLSAANPKIILARLTGFGQKGPYAKRPAFGTNIEAMTGIAEMTGEPDRPPMLPVFALGDYVASYAMVAAVMMALYHRDARGGEGQEIDVSLFRPLMSTLARQIIHWDQIQFLESRTGNRSASSAPRNAYLTKDGKWVCVSAATVKLAERVMALVGHPEFAKEPWFGTASGRVAHFAEIDAAITPWVAARTRDEVVAEAEKAEATFAPIYDIADVHADRHVRESGMIVEVEDPVLGTIRMPNVLFDLSKTPGGIRSPAPTLGNATEEVLVGELGIDRERIERLKARGAVA